MTYSMHSLESKMSFFQGCSILLIVVLILGKGAAQKSAVSADNIVIVDTGGMHDSLTTWPADAQCADVSACN